MFKTSNLKTQKITNRKTSHITCPMKCPQSLRTGNVLPFLMFSHSRSLSYQTHETFIFKWWDIISIKSKMKIPHWPFKVHTKLPMYIANQGSAHLQFFCTDTSSYFLQKLLHWYPTTWHQHLHWL